MSQPNPTEFNQRQVAIDLFNLTWRLLEKPDRNAEDDNRMLNMAHASRYHWGEVGQPVNRVRGEWQVSHVYSVLGRAEPALYHAVQCLEICQLYQIGDFDLAYAYEALARAYKVADNPAEYRHYYTLAAKVARDIAEADDKNQLLIDLESLESVE